MSSTAVAATEKEPREVFIGYLHYEGSTLNVEFDAPAGACEAETDLAFMAALSQQANLSYLSVGVIPAP
ncbi:MAG: hypothetical protein NT159_03425 [Proteobacteria bacterium]|nr:hypothetical protein [Pseudomonadota bacterium]